MKLSEEWEFRNPSSQGFFVRRTGVPIGKEDPLPQNDPVLGKYFEKMNEKGWSRYRKFEINPKGRYKNV